MVLFELEWNEMEFSGLTKLPVTNYKEPDMTTKTPFFCHGHAGMLATLVAAPAGKLNAILHGKKEKKAQG